MSRKKKNTFDDINDIIKLCKTTVETRLVELEQKLEEEKKKKKHYKGGWNLYTGLGGIAYMYWFLSEYTNRPDSRTDQEYKKKGYNYIKQAITKCTQDQERDLSCGTFLFSVNGLYSLGATLSTKPKEQTKYIKNILNWRDENKKSSIKKRSELFFGSAGYLSALLFLQRHVDLHRDVSNPKHNWYENSDVTDDFSSDMDVLDQEDLNARFGVKLNKRIRKCISNTSEQLFNNGRWAPKGLRHCLELTWLWKGKPYVGAAHGYAGILFNLIETYKDSKRIHECLESLSDQQEHGGNYALTLDIEKSSSKTSSKNSKSSSKSSKKNSSKASLKASTNSNKKILVQFCHGAPGVGMCFLQMARRTKTRDAANFVKCATVCGECVLKDGFLTTKGKGISLCHGSLGNAWFLLQLYHQTRDSKWLDGAKRFAILLDKRENSQHWYGAKDPLSLANGLAGAICFYNMLLYICVHEKKGLDWYFPTFPLLPSKE